MSRAHVCASILGLGLMLAAASTDARELELFVENRIGGDSNVFRRSKEGSVPTTRGGVWEIAPRLTLRDSKDELQYEFAYQPAYEQFFALEGNSNEDNVSGFDHNGRAELLWQADPTTSFLLDGSFFRQRRLRQEFVGAPLLAEPTLDATDNEYVQRGQGTARIDHALTNRLSVNASYSYDNFDVSQQNRSDSISHTGSVGTSYAVTQHTRLGVTGTARFRNTVASVDPDGTGAGGAIYDLTEFRSFTRTIDVSFSLVQNVTEHIDFSVAVGPSFFDTRDEQSIPNPFTGNTISYNRDDSFFALVRGTYRWRKGQIEGAYTRSEGGGGGTTGASSIVDDVSVRVVHQPTREWTLRLGISWSHRATIASDAFAGLDTRTDQVSGTGSVLRRINPNFSVIASVRYGFVRRDEFRASPPRDLRSETESVQGFVSIRYTFEPYVF